MAKREIEMGAMARPFKEQFPELGHEVAQHFDQDNLAISRLKLRDYVSHAELIRIRRRFTKAVQAAVLKAQTQESETA